MLHIWLSLAVLGMFILREFAYKPVADKYPPAVAMIADGGVGLLLALIVVVRAQEPLIWHPALLSSLVSGAILSYQVKFFQIVRKESLSANSYIMLISLGVGVLLSYVFGERLELAQYAVVIGIAIVGYGFFRWFVTDLSPAARKAWLIALLLTSIVISAPTFELSYTNWVSVFLARSIGNVVTDIYEFSKCRRQQTQPLNFDYSIFILSGYAMLFELLCMYANPILGVTTVLVLKRGGIPVIMVISYLLYHDGKKREQVIFASLAAALAILYHLAML